MAGLTGLFQRGNRYYLQVVLPLDHPLRPKFKNGKLVESLGTCSYREALQKGAIRRTHVLYGMANVLEAAPSTAKGACSQTSRHTLRDIHSMWKNSRNRSEDTVDACLRAVHLCEEFTCNLPIEELTRELGGTFRQWLEHPDRKTTSKTARDRLAWVKSLLEFAAGDLALLPRSPWTGIEIEFRTTTKRRPWTSDELTKLFQQPLHSTYELPSERKAGKHAAYWIPLLSLFTGARVGELAQLRVADVYVEGDIPFLSITDEGDNQHIKTIAGVRKVPIHSELLRLGFLDFVHKTRQGTSDSLWPDLPKRQGKPGGYFSQWFGVYRRQLGFERVPDFHCFRHTVRSQLAEIGTQEPIIDALIGHEVSGSVGAKVYTHRTLSKLSQTVELLSYPLILQKVSLPRQQDQ